MRVLRFRAVSSLSYYVPAEIKSMATMNASPGLVAVLERQGGSDEHVVGPLA